LHKKKAKLIAQRIGLKNKIKTQSNLIKKALQKIKPKLKGLKINSPAYKKILGTKLIANQKKLKQLNTSYKKTIAEITTLEQKIAPQLNALLKKMTEYINSLFKQVIKIGDTMIAKATKHPNVLRNQQRYTRSLQSMIKRMNPQGVKTLKKMQLQEKILFAQSDIVVSKLSDSERQRWYLYKGIYERLVLIRDAVLDDLKALKKVKMITILGVPKPPKVLPKKKKLPPKKKRATPPAKKKPKSTAKGKPAAPKKGQKIKKK